MVSAIIFLILVTGGVFISLAKHGEPKGNHSFGWTLFSTILTLYLLYNAGFFNIFNK